VDCGPGATRGNLACVKRPRYSMPADVEAALVEPGFIAAYDERPSDQQKDYLGWIGRAKRAETRQKRLLQMLDELEAGGVYMGMTHNPTRRRGRP
jgi:uncharacterized protein YdeI (YjbR/CyaY-like superfamily)